MDNGVLNSIDKDSEIVVRVECNYRENTYAEDGCFMESFTLGVSNVTNIFEKVGVVESIEIINDGKGFELSYTNGVKFRQEEGLYNYSTYDKSKDKTYSEI